MNRDPMISDGTNGREPILSTNVVTFSQIQPGERFRILSPELDTSVVYRKVDDALYCVDREEFRGVYRWDANANAEPLARVI